MRNKDRWQARPGDTPNETWGVVALTDPDPVRSQMKGGYKWIIPATHLLDAEDAAKIATTHNATLDSGGESKFMFMPIVSNRTRKPMIEVVFNGETATVSMLTAYRIQRQLADTIHSAIGEAFLYRFVIEKVHNGKADEKAQLAAFGLKQEYRLFVAEQLNQGDEFFTETGEDLSAIPDASDNDS